MRQAADEAAQEDQLPAMAAEASPWPLAARRGGCSMLTFALSCSADAPLPPPSPSRPSHHSLFITMNAIIGVALAVGLFFRIAPRTFSRAATYSRALGSSRSAMPPRAANPRSSALASFTTCLRPTRAQPCFSNGAGGDRVTRRGFRGVAVGFASGDVAGGFERA